MGIRHRSAVFGAAPSFLALLCLSVLFVALAAPCADAYMPPPSPYMPDGQPDELPQLPAPADVRLGTGTRAATQAPTHTVDGDRAGGQPFSPVLGVQLLIATHLFMLSR